MATMIMCDRCKKLMYADSRSNKGAYCLMNIQYTNGMTALHLLSKMTFSKEKWDEIITRNVWPIDNTPFQMRKDILEPVSIDKARVLMKHCEEKDGLIELRKGVSDIFIGDALYAQIIIRYDENHYIKGMAVYSDDVPTGFDVVVNYGPKDPVCPMANRCAFSANDTRPIKQQFYDNNTKLSPINIIALEGDWVEFLKKRRSNHNHNHT